MREMNHAVVETIQTIQPVMSPSCWLPDTDASKLGFRIDHQRYTYLQRGTLPGFMNLVHELLWGGTSLWASGFGVGSGVNEW